MDAEQWTIALDSWIVQDGNYPDFERGQHAEFAVEFWPTGKLDTVARSNSSAIQLSDSTYDVRGEVVLRTDQLWIIDCGLMVFQETEPPAIEQGEWVAGQIGLGVDPFFYFERLAGDRSVPPLVYPWTIDRIRMQTAPFVEQAERVLVRDEARLGWTDAERTEAWTDDGGRASYLLSCTRQAAGPQRSSSTAIGGPPVV